MRRPPTAPRMRVGAAAMLLLAVAGCGGGGASHSRSPAAAPDPAAAGVLRFHSRPDLAPDRVRVTVAARGRTAPGYVFLAVKRGPGRDGPMILDENGQLVWYLPTRALTAMDFKVQKYRGQPVLTWYEGDVLSGYGGRYHIYDNTYHEIAKVSAGTGFSGDLHEFLITSRDTALIAVYGQVTANLTAVGGAAAGQLVIGIVQEVDIATGKVVFQW